DRLEVHAREERLDVVERVHGHALAPNLAQRARVVGVVAHEGRHVEVHAEPCLPLVDEVTEAAVGVLAGAEASDLAQGPEASTVHGGIGAARVRVLAGQPEVLVAELLDVFGGVDALEREARQALVLGAGLWAAIEEGAQLSGFPRRAQRGSPRDLFPVEHQGFLLAAAIAASSAWSERANSASSGASATACRSITSASSGRSSLAVATAATKSAALLRGS